MRKCSRKVTVLMCLSLKSRLFVHRCSRNCPEICLHYFCFMTLDLRNAVCPLYFLVHSRLSHVPRNPSQHGPYRAPTSGPSTSSRTCSRRRRSGVWAARPASSPPSPWFRRPATSPRVAPRLSKRKKVGRPAESVYANTHSVLVPEALVQPEG